MLALTAALLFAQSAADPLDDPRLEKSASVRISAETVRDAFKTLSAASGVNLQADPAIKSDRITVYAAGRPMKEILRKISSHFNWEWKQSADGLILRQSPAQKAAEDSRRNKQICQQYYQGQARSRKLAEAAPPPMDDTFKKFAAISKQHDELLKSFGDDVSDEQEQKLDEVEQKQAELLDKLDPCGRFVQKVFAAMNESQLLELDRRGRIVFSYIPTRAQHSLGAASAAADRFLADAFRERDWVAKNLEGRESTPYEFPRFFRLTKDASPANIGTVRIVFRSSGDGSVWARAAVLDKEGLIVGSGKVYLQSEWDDRDSEPAQADRSAPSQIRSALTQKISFDKAAAAEQFGAQTIMTKFLKATLSLAESADCSDVFRTQSDALIAIAEAAGVPLIADCYDSSIEFEPTKLLPLLISAKTAGEAFDEYAKLAESKAVYENGWVGMRTDNWELKRAETVPPDVIAALNTARNRDGGLTIAAQLAFLSALDDLQVRSPLLPMSNDSLVQGWPEYNLWLHWAKAIALLSPVQWEQLKAGGSVAFGDMPLESRRELTEYLFRSPSILMSTSSDFPFEDFAFDTESPANQDVLQDSQSSSDDPIEDMSGDDENRGDPFPERSEDDETTQLLPGGPPPGAVLTLKIEKKQGASLGVNIGGLHGNLSGHVSAIAALTLMLESGGSIPELPFLQNVKTDGYRPADVEYWQFKLAFGDKTLGGGTLVSVRSSGPFGPIESLPAELKQRIEKSKAYFKKMYGTGGGDDSEPPPPPQTVHPK